MNTTDVFSDTSKKSTYSEININQAKIIKKLSDENAKLWEELNAAKYAISLLEKQMAGLRTKLAKIENHNNLDRPTE
jgi:hypothetical protein